MSENRKKTVVLLSSGLDSTVNFYQSLEKDSVVLALTLDYGQLAAAPETLRAEKICKLHNVPHQVLDVKWFSHFTKTSLVEHSQSVPQNVELEDDQACQDSAKSVWVPNRNGIMIHIAAGFAEGLGADEIVVGFNKEEAATFPDNSVEFLNSLNQSLKFSTMNQVQVKSYTTHMDKKEIVALGRKLKVPFELIWSCYLGGDNPCQQCESCLRLQRALGL